MPQARVPTGAQEASFGLIFKAGDDGHQILTGWGPIGRIRVDPIGTVL